MFIVHIIEQNKCHYRMLLLKKACMSMCPHNILLYQFFSLLKRQAYLKSDTTRNNTRKDYNIMIIQHNAQTFSRYSRISHST